MKFGCISAALCLALCLGCAYKGAKIVEGTDMSLGVSLPGTSGMADMAVVNWLSGFRFAVANGAELTLEYTNAETNTYFGCVTTRTFKQINATVTPVEYGSTNEQSIVASPQSLATTNDQPTND